RVRGQRRCALCGLPYDVSTIRCTACGYDLSGLANSSGCPECGFPVARSRRGDLLWNSSPTRVRRLLTGALLAEGAAMASIVCFVVLIAARSGLNAVFPGARSWRDMYTFITASLWFAVTVASVI